MDYYSFAIAYFLLSSIALKKGNFIMIDRNHWTTNSGRNYLLLRNMLTRQQNVVETISHSKRPSSNNIYIFKKFPQYSPDISAEIKRQPLHGYASVYYVKFANAPLSKLLVPRYVTRQIPLAPLKSPNFKNLNIMDYKINNINKGHVNNNRFHINSDVMPLPTIKAPQISTVNSLPFNHMHTTCTEIFNLKHNEKERNYCDTKTIESVTLIPTIASTQSTTKPFYHSRSTRSSYKQHQVHTLNTFLPTVYSPYRYHSVFTLDEASAFVKHNNATKTKRLEEKEESYQRKQNLTAESTTKEPTEPNISTSLQINQFSTESSKVISTISSSVESPKLTTKSSKINSTISSTIESPKLTTKSYNFNLNANYIKESPFLENTTSLTSQQITTSLPLSTIATDSNSFMPVLQLTTIFPFITINQERNVKLFTEEKRKPLDKKEHSNLRNRFHNNINQTIKPNPRNSFKNKSRIYKNKRIITGKPPTSRLKLNILPTIFESLETKKNNSKPIYRKRKNFRTHMLSSKTSTIDPFHDTTATSKTMTTSTRHTKKAHRKWFSSKTSKRIPFNYTTATTLSTTMTTSTRHTNKAHRKSFSSKRKHATTYNQTINVSKKNEEEDLKATTTERVKVFRYLDPIPNTTQPHKFERKIITTKSAYESAIMKISSTNLNSNKCAHTTTTSNCNGATIPKSKKIKTIESNIDVGKNNITLIPPLPIEIFFVKSIIKNNN